jgi:aspartyl-tRNA(Asn)/glutamyl-tRNA(Gln) amidotransferase subunit B
MEEGSLRCDANVSIRPEGQKALGTRTELKNLNSFRNVQRALEHEIERQKTIVEAGGSVEQETVLWDAAAGMTRPMRGKEEAHDYRYFPEPDLPALDLDEAWVGELRQGLPELPAARKRRMAASYGLSEHEAHRLTLEAPLAAYYEEVARASGNLKAAANFILNDLLREQKQAGKAEVEIPLSAAHLAELIRLVDEGIISVSVARQELFPEMYRSGAPPADLVRSRGLEQVSDDATLRSLIREVLEENPRQLEQFRAGKKGLLGYFVGRVMRRSGGKADPKKVSELLEDETG